MKKIIVSLLHVGYWVMYLFLLLIFFLLFFGPGHPNRGNQAVQLENWFILMAGFAIVPGIIGFYTSYTLLYNRLFTKRKTGWLIGMSLLAAIIAALAGDITISISNGPELVFNDVSSFLFVTGIAAFGALINGMIGLVMKGFVTSYADIKLKEELSRRNAEMELELIKAQINPHFLFNTINNIDTLIEKDPPKASAYLNKLSDIMRFMLYEANAGEIPLGKETEYIGKYIELQKLRTSTPNYVNYTAAGDTSGWTIAPMLLIPFIENAFKHAENRKMENAINIRLDVSPEKLIFDCENHYAAAPQRKPEQGGLGNELIRRRLALLYPDRHKLELSNMNGTYKVNLTIYKNVHQLHHH